MRKFLNCQGSSGSTFGLLWPLKHYTNAFNGHNNPKVDLDDSWQFKNFLITDGD